MDEPVRKVMSSMGRQIVAGRPSSPTPVFPTEKRFGTLSVRYGGGWTINLVGAENKNRPKKEGEADPGFIDPPSSMGTGPSVLISDTSSRLYPGKLQATGTAKADEHPTPYLASSFNKQVLSTRRTNPRAPFSTTSRVYRAPPTADQAGSTGDVPKSFKTSSKFSRSPSHVFPSDATRAKFDKLWGREMPASPGPAHYEAHVARDRMKGSGPGVVRWNKPKALPKRKNGRTPTTKIYRF